MTTTEAASAKPTTFTEPLPAIERALAGFAARWTEPPALREAVEYALLAPGKRVRPLLAWHAAEAIRPGAGETALPAAVAVELVHAFSLVHDDLPAMDDDDLRRGRPTLHRAHGEAMAILAGDAMLNLAFAALAELPDPVVATALCREMTRGTAGMIGGQVLDTLGPSGATSGVDPERLLRRIHREKTGALIIASCRMGAIAAGAHMDSDELAALTEYAEAIGLLFQVVDDLIDVEQSAEHAGKRTGKDTEAGKLTFPGLLGIEASRAEAAGLAAQARSAIDRLTGGEPGDGPGASRGRAALSEVIEIFQNRTK